jgi:hypothetical protein
MAHTIIHVVTFSIFNYTPGALCNYDLCESGKEKEQHQGFQRGPPP